jgi:hypothetical protein
MHARDMDFTPLQGLERGHASHGPAYDRCLIFLSPQVFTEEENRWIASSHGDFLLDRLTITGELHADSGARQPAAGVAEIPIGRNRKGELVTQLADRSHNGSFANG